MRFLIPISEDNLINIKNYKIMGNKNFDKINIKENILELKYNNLYNNYSAGIYFDLLLTESI